MAQADINICMDEDLKNQFSCFCDSVGITMTGAFCLFAKQAVMQNKMPFEVSAPVDTTREDAICAFYEMRQLASENGLSGMTLDEINAEISAARAGR